MMIESGVAVSGLEAQWPREGDEPPDYVPKRPGTLYHFLSYSFKLLRLLTSARKCQFALGVCRKCIFQDVRCMRSFCVLSDILRRCCVCVGNTYKLRADSHTKAIEWCRSLDMASRMSYTDQVCSPATLPRCHLFLARLLILQNFLALMHHFDNLMFYIH